MTSNLHIQGMTCNHCVKAVTGALKSVPGVQSAEVSLETGTANVTFDEHLATEADLRTAIVQEGYSVA